MSLCRRCVQSTSMTMPQLAFLYEMDADWFGRSVPKTPLSPFPRVCCSWTGIKMFPYSDSTWCESAYFQQHGMFRLLKIWQLGVSTCFNTKDFYNQPTPQVLLNLSRSSRRFSSESPSNISEKAVCLRRSSTSSPLKRKRLWNPRVNSGVTLQFFSWAFMLICLFTRNHIDMGMKHQHRCGKERQIWMV